MYHNLVLSMFVLFSIYNKTICIQRFPKLTLVVHSKCSILQAHSFVYLCALQIYAIMHLRNYAVTQIYAITQLRIYAITTGSFICLSLRITNLTLKMSDRKMVVERS